MAPKAAARAPPRFAAALLLLAAAVMVQLETAAADPCIPLDVICNEDPKCRACKEATSVNNAGFEECVIFYGFSDDVCVNQSMTPCCLSEASKHDCLANVAYLDFYGCRLSEDVPGGECTALICDAVGANAPTLPPTEAGADTTTETNAGATTETDATAAPIGVDTTTDADADAVAVVQDDDVGAEDGDADGVDAVATDAESSAGRPVPSLLARTAGSSKAGFLGAAGLSAVVAVVAAAAFV